MQAEAQQERQGRERDRQQAVEQLNAVQRECDTARQERDAAQGEIAALKHAAEMLKATIEEEHGKEESLRVQAATALKKAEQAAKDTKAAKSRASKEHTALEQTEHGFERLQREYNRVVKENPPLSFECSPCFGPVVTPSSGHANACRPGCSLSALTWAMQENEGAVEQARASLAQVEELERAVAWAQEVQSFPAGSNTNAIEPCHRL